MQKSKARKTGFEVAHVDIGEGDAGWVYKSGPAAPVVSAPEPASCAAAAPRRSSAPPSIDESRDWMETGARVLVFPVACALVAIAAPVIWVMSSRARQ